jgi:hypothetical protein
VCLMNLKAKRHCVDLAGAAHFPDLLLDLPTDPNVTQFD